jgi:hypothetical protein
VTLRSSFESRENVGERRARASRNRSQARQECNAALELGQAPGGPVTPLTRPPVPWTWRSPAGLTTAVSQGRRCESPGCRRRPATIRSAGNFRTDVCHGLITLPTPPRSQPPRICRWKIAATSFPEALVKRREN